MRKLAIITVCVVLGWLCREAVLPDAGGKTWDPADAVRLVPPGIAYQPSAYRPGGEFTTDIERVIAEDLAVLRDLGIRSLVTYGAMGSFAKIPEMARATGFDGTIICGVWDPNDDVELRNAAGQRDHVDGYCIGNEGLGVLYSSAELAAAMNRLRTRTGRPVTTSEPIDRYLEGDDAGFLAETGDWLFPLAHPYWAGLTRPREAVGWVVAHADLLAARTGRQVILKEAGVPSRCADGCSGERQADFFRALATTDAEFFFFEAFDQPWKSVGEGAPAVESHWGIMTDDRQAKRTAEWLTEHAF